MQGGKGNKKQTKNRKQNRTREHTNNKTHTETKHHKNDKSLCSRWDLWDGWDVVRTGQVRQKVYEALKRGKLSYPRTWCQGNYGFENYIDWWAKSGKRPPDQAKQKHKSTKQNRQRQDKPISQVKQITKWNTRRTKAKISLGCIGRLRNWEAVYWFRMEPESCWHNTSQRKAGGPRRLPQLHIEKTQWSPNCKGYLSRSWPTSANLCRNPVQYLEAVGTFPLAYLPCHPCPSLCFVLEGQTVSGVAQLPRVGSFEMQGKRDLCQLRPIVFAIPGLGSIRAGHRIYVAGSLGWQSQALRRSKPSLGGEQSCCLVERVSCSLG